MQGRICVVTGANTGIGKAAALELARQGAHVVLGCRSRERGEKAMADIRWEVSDARLELLELDLGSLDSVRRAAEQLLAQERPIHVLVNNAGLAGVRGLTADGFEMTFGVNHVGHFLFTTLLLDRLRASAPARIVTVSSEAHYQAKGIDYQAVRQPMKGPIGLHEYEVSKLANVLFSAELARRLAGTGVSTYAVHPGRIASDIWRRIPWPVRKVMLAFMGTTDEGAKTVIHCATSPEAAAETGLYYHDCKPRAPNPLAEDRALAADLWRRSEEWCAPHTQVAKIPAATG